MRRAVRFSNKVTSVIISYLCGISAVSATDIKEVSVHSTVKAKPTVVWEAIRHQRKTDVEHRKLLSYHDNEATIEEKFPGLPIIGAATCLYKECEVPLKRIDYSMISSDQFRTFEGSWVLTPSADGQETEVDLSSSLDPGVRVPFWKEISKMATMKHIRKRLEDVQHDAELESGRK
jgi:hypothetical protein